MFSIPRTKRRRDVFNTPFDAKTNVAHWFCAKDFHGLSDGMKVRSWRDRGPNGSHAYAVGSNAAGTGLPEIALNMLAAGPVVKFVNSYGFILPQRGMMPNNFAWFALALPTASITLKSETTTAGGTYPGTTGQKYLVDPSQTTDSSAFGVSLGTNGIQVVEHTDNYLPITSSYAATLTDWHLFCISYKNRLAYTYIDGVLVHTGLQATYYNSSAFSNNSSGTRGIGTGTYGNWDGYLAEWLWINGYVEPERVAAISNRILRSWGK